MINQEDRSIFPLLVIIVGTLGVIISSLCMSYTLYTANDTTETIQIIQIEVLGILVFGVISLIGMLLESNASARRQNLQTEEIIKVMNLKRALDREASERESNRNGK